MHASAADGRGEGGAWLRLRLPRRSLYVLRGEARYEWAHAMPLAQEWDDGVALPPRGRRVALIFREAVT